MYHDHLLQLSKDMRFRHSERLPGPSSERRNPACGDEVALYLNPIDGTTGNLRVYVQGCAVSAASASAMCEEISHISLETARERIEQALEYFAGQDDWLHDWGSPSLPALGEVRARPMRMTCVRLAWEALQSALNA
ncbi:MAG: iron-sulfur cluster assembly scaffold protein [Kiritimatiellia bacterium]